MTISTFVPKHRESNCFARIVNRLEYFWKVHMVPVLRISMGVMFVLLTLLVIFLELSLFLAWNQD